MIKVIVPCCKQKFCFECIYDQLEKEEKCLCQKKLLIKDLQLLHTEEIPTDYEEKKKNIQSTKVRALLSHLTKLRNEDSTTKSVIYSQWTSLLDLLEIPLKENNFKFVRLDGCMSNEKKQKSLKKFHEDPTVTIFLVSLKAGFFYVIYYFDFLF